MKNEKNIIGEKENMNNQEEFTTEKKQGKGIKKCCIFASALVLFGTVAGISLNKNGKTKDDVSISTSSSNSLESSIISSQSEQVPIVLRYCLRVKEAIGVIKKDNEDVYIYKDTTLIYAKSEILIPKTDKEVIAIKLVNPEIVQKDDKMGYKITFTDFQLIYDGDENIPADYTMFDKEVSTSEDGLPVYSCDYNNLLNRSYSIENSDIENEQSSKTK